MSEMMVLGSDDIGEGEKVNEKLIISIDEITPENLNEDELHDSLWGILSEKPVEQLPYSYERIVNACMKYSYIYQKVDQFLSQIAIKQPEAFQKKVYDLQYYFNRKVSI